MGKTISLIFTRDRIYYITILVIIIAILFLFPSRELISAINNKIIRPLNNITIVVDPGHGGIDGGTSFGDILEKHINLSIGLKLKEELIKRGATVIMTREIDDSLDDHIDNGSRHREDLEERVRVANDNQADIFISIHVNHSKNENRKGPIIFYDEYSEESKKFAVIMQDYLNKLSSYQKLDKHMNHSVTTGGFYTLQNIKSPGIIVEMGFMSNDLDRELLLEDKHQNEVIDLIARSVISYINEIRQEKLKIKLIYSPNSGQSKQ